MLCISNENLYVEDIFYSSFKIYNFYIIEKGVNTHVCYCDGGCCCCQNLSHTLPSGPLLTPGTTPA